MSYLLETYKTPLPVRSVLDAVDLERVDGVARLARSDDLQWPGPTRPPKIVGLDFAVDAAGDAWLLEVNRTPGLVGRAEVDRAVKDAVVDAAWGLREDVLEELLL